MLMIDKVRERAEEFDVLHFHIDLFHFPLFRSLAARTLTTLHGRQDLGDLKPFLFPLRRNAIGFHLQRPAQTIAQAILLRRSPRHSARPASAVV
jgi:hypothetical protein